MFEIQLFTFFNLVQKLCIKKFESEIYKILVPAFAEGSMLIRIQTELSSVKTIRGIRSGYLKVIFFGEPLKVPHIQCEHSKLYTLRYNARNVAMYAYYNVAILYAYYNLTMYTYYNVNV